MKTLGWLALALGMPTVALAQVHVTQSTALASQRTELATYDLSGRRTLDALRALGPVAASTGTDASEAAFLRAIAATDLHVAALGLGDTALDARLAEAMGVPADHLAEELRTELTRAQVGVYRGPVAAELTLLAHAEAGGPQALDTHDPREAGLFTLAAGRAARAHDLSTLGATRTTATRPAWLVGPGSTGDAALRAGLAAHVEARRGVAEGDPLLVAWSSALDGARDALLAYEMRASPAVLDTGIVLVAAPDGASAGDVPDVLVVIDATRIAIACGARVRVTSATELATTLPSTACPEPGALRTIALPTTLPTVPGPIDELVAAFTALALPSTTVVAVSPTATAPMHVVTRVLRSMARASLTPTQVALGTGTDLHTSPIALAGAADTPTVTIHVRLGGYAIERTRGRDAQVPRIRGAHGLEYDHTGLMAALTADAVTAAAVDAMGSVPMVEVLGVMRTLASSGARVTLALP